MNRRQLLATTGAVASLGLCAGIVAGSPGCTSAPAAELPASPTMGDMIDRAKATRQAWSDTGHESDINPSAENKAAFVQAQDDYNGAIEALMRHRPATVEEAGDRLAWLWSFGGPWDGLFPSDEEIALLLGSMARTGRLSQAGDDAAADPFLSRMKRYDAENVIYDASEDDDAVAPWEGVVRELESGQLIVTSPAAGADALQRAMNLDCIGDTEAELLVRAVMAYLKSQC